jgi:uncharacterized membrane protein HdeD (DUF308 family)
MIERRPVEAKHPERRAAYGITLARSILALALGLILIFEPDKARPILINFIGMFWFVAGLMNLRWNAAGERARRTSIVVGIVGVVAGVMVLGRFLLSQIIGVELMVLLLSFIVILTGLVHMFEGFLTGSGGQRQRSWTSTLLGVFELILGLAVLVSRDDPGPVFYTAITIWAFTAALVLLRQGLRQRAIARGLQATSSASYESK